MSKVMSVDQRWLQMKVEQIIHKCKYKTQQMKHQSINSEIMGLWQAEQK